MMNKLHFVVLSAAVAAVGWAYSSIVASQKSLDGTQHSTTGVKVPLQEVIAEIHNDDVCWDGNTFGLEPQVRGATRLATKYWDSNCEKLLLAALKSKDRYIAAHVVLAKHYDPNWKTNRGTWYGMTVNLFVGRPTGYKPSEQTHLAKRWNKWCAGRRRKSRE